MLDIYNVYLYLYRTITKTAMKAIIITNNKSFKKLVESERESITNINGVEFNPTYPMIEASNKHASYYNPVKGDVYLQPPFVVSLNK